MIIHRLARVTTWITEQAKAKNPLPKPTVGAQGPGKGRKPHKSNKVQSTDDSASMPTVGTQGPGKGKKPVKGKETLPHFNFIKIVSSNHDSWHSY